MKSRRSMPPLPALPGPPDLPDPPAPPDLVVARQTIVRRLFLPMTVHAEPHAVVDGTLGDRLVRHVAVARRAGDAGPDVRRVVEAHMRFAREAVHALPRNLDALLRVLGDLFDERTVGGDLAVADHAGLHARDAGDRALFDALVAVDAFRLFVDVGFVRERNRLFGLRPDGEERPRRFGHRPMRRREDLRGG